jgi:hypothetical protein
VKEEESVGAHMPKDKTSFEQVDEEITQKREQNVAVHTQKEKGEGFN